MAENVNEKSCPHEKAKRAPRSRDTLNWDATGGQGMTPKQMGGYSGGGKGEKPAKSKPNYGKTKRKAN